MKAAFALVVVTVAAVHRRGRQGHQAVVATTIVATTIVTTALVVVTVSAVENRIAIPKALLLLAVLS